MRQWTRWIVAALLLGLVGCAGSRPCMVIPAQLELAEDLREAARARLEDKTKELNRWSHAIDQSRTRLERLTEDRDQLRGEVVGSEEEQK